MRTDAPSFASPTKQASSRSPLAALGPGLITGAADDDPSGIATYSQAGAAFGYGLLWTALATLPLMIGVQLMCARLGIVTRRGLGATLRRWYPPWLLWSACVLLAVANVINIAADLSGIGAAVRLVTGVSAVIVVPLVAALTLLLVARASYAQVARALRWLTLSLVAYIGTALLAHPGWSGVVRHTVLPVMPWTRESVALVVAVFGTTISPYLFFWQASEEAEELPSIQVPMPEVEMDGRLRVARSDVASGMTFSNVIGFFIILTTGATLHRAGITSIDTAAQAAESLRPLAGELASLLFALGMIGTGMLAIPVLAGSASYAVAEAMRRRSGMNERPATAPTFYRVFAATIAAATLLSALPIPPMRLLFWAAIVNGVLAPPLIVVLLVVCNDARVLGTHRNGFWLNVLGGTTALVMTGAVVAMVLL